MKSSESGIPNLPPFHGEIPQESDIDAVTKAFFIINGLKDFNNSVARVLADAGLEIEYFTGRTLRETLSVSDYPVKDINPKFYSQKSRKAAVAFFSGPSSFTLSGSGNLTAQEQYRKMQNSRMFHLSSQQIHKVIGNAAEYIELDQIMRKKGNPLLGNPDSSIAGVRVFDNLNYGIVADFGEGLEARPTPLIHKDPRIYVAPLFVVV